MMLFWVGVAVVAGAAVCCFAVLFVAADAMDHDEEDSDNE